MLKRVAIISLSLMLSAQSVLAATCDELFPDGIQINNNAGVIQFKDNSLLLNNPDTILETRKNITSDSNANCDGLPCTISGSIVNAVDYNSFPGGDDESFDNETATLLPGDYDEISLTNGSEITLSAGDYILKNELILDDASRFIIPDGDIVRFFVKEKIEVKNGSQINNSGLATQLLLFSRKSILITDSSQVNAFIYSKDNTSLEGGSSVVGAIQVKNSILKDASSVTFYATVPNFGDYCSGPEPPFQPECQAIFPGQSGNAAPASSPVGFIGSLDDITIGNNVVCDGGSDCDESDFVSISNGRVPLFPEGGIDLKEFGDNEAGNNDSQLIDKAYNLFDGWESNHTTVSYVDASGTAVVYIQSNDHVHIPEGTTFNVTSGVNGQVNNALLVIESDDHVHIDEDVLINGFVYIVSPKDVNIKEGTVINGGLTVETPKLKLEDNVQINYQVDGLNGFDPHGFCDALPPPAFTCADDSSYPVVFADDFSSPNSWQATDFNRTVGNWPNDSRFYDSNTEEQNVIYAINNDELRIAGAAQTGGHNEYGMVAYDLVDEDIDSSTAIEYSIQALIYADKGALNNDTGIIFAYQDDENYYMARWAKYGRNYRNDNNFPGEYRRFEIVEMNAGVARQVAGQDSLDLDDDFTLKVIVNNNGIGVCTGDISGNNMQLRLTSTESTALKKIGVFSYDNDDGLRVDDVEVRCTDCQTIVPPDEVVALYSFEHNDLTQITDTSGNNRHGIDLGGESIANGKYCRGFDSPAQDITTATDKAFQSGVDLIDDVGLEGTISFWFNSHTDWNLGGYNGGERTLFDASLAGFGNSNKYFHLGIESNGLLRFAFEDSSDADFFIEEPASTVRTADTWYYVTVTWDFNQNRFQIYVDGNLRIEQDYNTNGSLSNLGAIIFGDNASTYAESGQGALPSTYSANGLYDEVRIHNRVRTSAEINQDMNDETCVSTVDHYEIRHDGQGLTCEAEGITIVACADESCSSLDDAPFSLDLSINGVFNQTITSTSGSAVAQFYYGTPGAATLSLSETYECVNGGSSSCDVNFVDAAFVFSVILDQIAGHDFSGVTLSARENVNGVCQDIFTGDVTVELAVEYQSPDRATTNIYTVKGGEPIAKNNNGLLNNYTDVELNFNGVPSADLGLNNYGDAGQIKLHAKYTMPATVERPAFDIFGSSVAFWVEPDHFELNANNSAGLLNGTSAQATQIQAAGEPFSFEIIAKNLAGNTTTNYIAAQPQVKLVRTGPTTVGNEGVLQVSDSQFITSVLATNSPKFLNRLSIVFDDAGRYQYNAATYSEVGLIELSYRDPDYGVLAKPTHPEGSTNVGRFIPHHFEQTVERNGVLQSTHDASEAGCVLDSWAYSGELDLATIGSATPSGAINYSLPPRYRITAYNSDGDVTENYTSSGDGNYRKLMAENVKVTEPLKDAEQEGSLSVPATPELVDLSAQMHVGSLIEETGGVMLYSFHSDDNFTYTHNKNAEIKPFQAKVPLAVAEIIDSDGVLVDVGDLNDPNNNGDTETAVPSGVEVRFGRLVIENSYGPETSNLPQNIFIEYLTALADFSVHMDDQCTLFDSNKLTLTDEGLPPSIPGFLPSNGRFVDGRTRELILTAPGAGKQGDIGVSYDIYPWLEYDWDNDNVIDNDPQATASFGLYRGNDRIIYRREVSQ